MCLHVIHIHPLKNKAETFDLKKHSTDSGKLCKLEIYMPANWHCAISQWLRKHKRMNTWLPGDRMKALYGRNNLGYNFTLSRYSYMYVNLSSTSYHLCLHPWLSTTKLILKGDGPLVFTCKETSPTPKWLLRTFLLYIQLSY